MRWFRLIIGYYVLHYDEESLATNQNYNIATVGLNLRQDISKATTLSGSFSYDNTSYRQLNARSSSTVSIGAGVDHSFGARLLGSLNGGYQLKAFEASISGQNSPYGNLSFTYLFDPRLRLTAGASYSLWEADLLPYANQERFTGYFALGYDISPRISFSLSGGVTRGKYNAEQVYTTPVGPTTLGGVDNIYQVGSRLSYQVNRHNWLDVSYSHSTGASDIRPDFDVNTYAVGWRVSY
ncbi:MAG: outer membrane beta-barrel protein [Kiritimatiellaeota bacterium]|nr:outer membrane beta-barrel protein [Kiritimatiellota bacterium]